MIVRVAEKPRHEVAMLFSFLSKTFNKDCDAVIVRVSDRINFRKYHVGVGLVNFIEIDLRESSFFSLNSWTELGVLFHHNFESLDESGV